MTESSQTPQTEAPIQRVVMLTQAEAKRLEAGAAAPATKPLDSAQGEADTTSGGLVLPFAAPADADEAVAVGYAVYDRQLGQYVGGVTRGTDDKAKAKARSAAKGDQLAVVRV